jgi:hypothetical protein
MPLRHLTKPLPMIALVLAVFPVLLILSLLGYACQARLHLGHWPYYEHPDPKDLGWWFQHSVLQLGFIGFPLAALGAVCLAIIGRSQSREFPLWTVIGTAAISTGLLVAYGRLDPGGFVSWFWD